MFDHIRRSVTLALIALVLFGLVYGLLGTGVSQLFFRGAADGSITANGSTSIGQSWNDYKTNEIVNPQWFHGRPDADDPLGANGKAGTSGAANLGPRSKTLLDQTRELVQAWHKVGVNPTPNLVTTSASGIDPDIGPLDAQVQIPMVSRATGISPTRLQKLIADNTQGAELGFLGSPTVNVLQLNEALARLR